MKEPGDIIGGRFEVLSAGPVSYQGDLDCTVPSHDHRYVGGHGREHMIPGCLTGYHCPQCGAPCPMTGHECESGTQS